MVKHGGSAAWRARDGHLLLTRAVCTAVSAAARWATPGLIVLAALTGCGSDGSGGTPPSGTPTAALVRTPTQVATHTPLAPTGTATSVATHTPPATASMTATPSATMTATPSGTPTATPTSTATATPLPAYAPGWSAVHADGSNTDYSPVVGAANVTLLWARRFEGSIRIGPLPWTINLGPTVAPDGQVYLTSTVLGCHLQALDGATGATRWCATDVGLFAVASSPLIDREGRLYIADGEVMRALDAGGSVLWETPIVGVPFSAQFTAEGRLIFVTHIGVIYVLDRVTGAAMLPPLELIPGAIWDPAQGIFACATGTAQCPSANTPAVDARTGRFFFTFWAPGAAQAGLRAMRYTEDPAPALTDLWVNEALPGGSASSPVLSADGTRVYVNDYVDSMHALDAATGAEVWSVTIGFASGGSPSLSPDGLLMPSGGGPSPLLAVRDLGDRGVLAWRNDALLNRSLPMQAAGGRVYATVDAGQFRNDLVVLDASDGTELDREPLLGVAVFSVGTTMGLDGTIYVPTIVGGLYAFRAE